ncbi:Uncharacterized protein Adt_30415 [Abeliophyllum distichum]|uniref:Uncharacterized protein n=1 Tax=Abeliophyllum distichum TaxID=126358 RepID=A0ABD1RB66_9LAMI
MASNVNVYVNTIRYTSSPAVASFLPSCRTSLFRFLMGKTQNDSVALNNGTNGVMVDGVRYSKDLDESDENSLGVTITPAATPGNMPRKFLALMVQFDWNIAVPPSKENFAPIPEFE